MVLKSLLGVGLFSYSSSLIAYLSLSCSSSSSHSSSVAWLWFIGHGFFLGFSDPDLVEAKSVLNRNSRTFFR